jgi:hypothetical protein
MMCTRLRSSDLQCDDGDKLHANIFLRTPYQNECFLAPKAEHHLVGTACTTTEQSSDETMMGGECGSVKLTDS